MKDYNEYLVQTAIAKDIFISKFGEYGASYKLFRDISMLEQIDIKLKRIIKIQNGEEMLVNDIGDDIVSEYLGIYNYAIQYYLRYFEGDAHTGYTQEMESIKTLMVNKDNDYGSAWEGMHLWSLTDLMSVKISRIKNMILNEMNNTKVDEVVTEGIFSNIQDLANYAIFCLIKIDREED